MYYIYIYILFYFGPNMFSLIIHRITGVWTGEVVLEISGIIFMHVDVNNCKLGK